MLFRAPKKSREQQIQAISDSEDEDDDFYIVEGQHLPETECSDNEDEVQGREKGEERYYSCRHCRRRLREKKSYHRRKAM